MRIYQPKIRKKKKIESFEDVVATENMQSQELFMAQLDEMDIDDIEELVHSIPPIEKFNKNLRFNVTDFAEQLWCEKQLEFTLVTGRKRQTAQMKIGTERHASLEQLDHEMIEVEVATQEDYLGICLLNTITLFKQCLEWGKARELWIFGVYHNCLIRGYIDEIELLEDKVAGTKQVLISDTKTRSSQTEPSDAQKQTTRIQLQLYWWMLDQLRRGAVDVSILFKAYRCDPVASFESPELENFKNLNELTNQLLQSFRQSPPLAHSMKIVYEYAGEKFSECEVHYSEPELLHELNLLLQWWYGERDAYGVLISERWKCRNCEFLEECSSCPLSSDEIAQIKEKRTKVAYTTTAEILQ